MKDKHKDKKNNYPPFSKQQVILTDNHPSIYTYPAVQETQVHMEVKNVHYTGCFTTLGRNCSRWFPRSLWSKKFI